MLMVTAEQVKKHLVANGWKQDIEFKNKNLMVFEYENSGFKIAIPSSEEYADFERGLLRVLDTIADFEGKTSEQVIIEMLEN